MKMKGTGKGAQTDEAPGANERVAVSGLDEEHLSEVEASVVKR
jgi:hypothetical protein